MKGKHLFEISKALLLARSKQTLVAGIGVTFSVAFFISLLGFMEGLNTLLDGLVLNRTPHIRLFNELRPTVNQPISLDNSYDDDYVFISSLKPTNARKEIYNVEKIMNALSSDKRVKGFSPKITAQVFFNLGNIELNGIVNGIDAIQEVNLFNFKDYVFDGSYLDLKTISNSIIIGKGIADKMQVKKGDFVQLTTNSGEQFSLKIVGFFSSGVIELDKTQSFVSMSTCQKLLGKPKNYITDVQVKLKDMNQAPIIAKEYEEKFELNAEDIQTANAQFETGSSARTMISFVVGIVLLTVAGFGIYNILNMMIYEKMDTIAILKATGFSGLDVKKIFLSISLSIGFGGAIFGALLGFIFSLMIDFIPYNSAALPLVDTYPVDYNIQFYLIAIVFAVATTFFAGWFPSQKASSIDPVDIIRGK